MKEKRSLKYFRQLIEIASILRGENGCVWDKEQTGISLKPFLLEECYEVLSAVDAEDAVNLKEELGDLLYQVIFMAQIFSEEEKFDIADVLKGICDKLIRRHPHVFGDDKVNDSKEVLAKWEKIKEGEKGKCKHSVLEGIPKQLPGLMRAHRVQEKAARVGFDMEHIDQVFDKVKEEMGEFEASYHAKDGQMEKELGDILFSLVNMARFISIDPEKALNKAICRFMARFRFIEKNALAEGKELTDMSLHEMDNLWEAAKKREIE